MQAIPKEDISDTPHYPASRTILLISAFSIPSQTSFSPWWCTKDAQVFQKLESICWEGTSDCNLRLHQIHLIALHMDYEINTTPRGPVLNHCLNSTVLHYALDTTSLIAFFRHISLPLKNINSTSNYFWCAGQKRFLLVNFQEGEWFSLIYLIFLTGI